MSCSLKQMQYRFARMVMRQREARKRERNETEYLPPVNKSDEKVGARHYDKLEVLAGVGVAHDGRVVRLQLEEAFNLAPRPTNLLHNQILQEEQLGFVSHLNI